MVIVAVEREVQERAADGGLEQARPRAFQRAVEHVRGTTKIKREDAGAILAGYMAGMEALVAWLDKFQA